MPYAQLNAMLDAAYPKGALNYWKSSFLSRLSDDAIRTMIECFARCPTPMGQLLLEHFHGAVTRVGSTDTAFPHRAEGYNIARALRMDGAGRSDGLHRLGAGNLCGACEPFIGAGRYVNYFGDDETRRCDRRRVRAELSAAAGDQDEVRPEQFLPHEPEHPAFGIEDLKRDGFSRGR